ncbi:hypothetical protein [Kitasatospora kifunensis]|uniref:Integral membrane protein n=1 Tax=Kitasatospora kifunensis TaxID=58351 RepID=A0A7W7VZ05_KITKI|nr:hypothetical protein [Kitasatospora kifunensis]MBB4928287.1 hypothetical protein [Kitasatospora kifunensis]
MTALLRPAASWWSRLRLLGTARLRTAVLLAALAATTATVLTSLPAWADPAPTPSPTATSSPGPTTPTSTTAPATAPGPTASGQDAPSPEQQAQLQEILSEQQAQLTADQQDALLAARTDQLRKLLPSQGGVLSVFNVTDRYGIPIEAYTVTSDTGGITDWDLGIYNLLAELCFMVVKWAIAFCCWLIAWALSFGLAKVLLAPVMSVATSLHTRVVVEMGLPSLALAVCALLCVGRFFFGDRARGWGDAALSILIAALTTTLLASPPTLLMGTDHGAIAAARGLALEVADTILQANPAAQTKVGADITGADLARPLTDALTDSFIVQPAMLLQYGQVFDGGCATAYTSARVSQLAYEQAVTEETDKVKKATDGLTGGLVSDEKNVLLDLTGQWIGNHLGAPPMDHFEKKCVTGDVASAKKAGLDKVGGAVFLLVAALIVAALISVLAGSFLVAQARIAYDAIRGEAALIAGTIPGAGRSWLWDWCASVLRSLAQMLTSVIALAIFIVIVQALLTPAQSDWGKELTLRFLAVDIVSIAAFRRRRRIAERSRQITSAWRTKMSAGRIGGTGGSVFAAPASATIAKRPQIAKTAARVAVRSAMAGVSLAQGNPLAAIGYAMPQSIGATALMSRLATSGRTRRIPRPAARPAGRRPSTAGGSRRPAQQNTRPNPATRTDPPTIEMPAVPDPATSAPSNPPTTGTPPVPSPATATPSSTPPPTPPRRPATGMALDWSRFDTNPTSTPGSANSTGTTASTASGPAAASAPTLRRTTPRGTATRQAPTTRQTQPAPPASAHQQRLRQRLERSTRRTPPSGESR